MEKFALVLMHPAKLVRSTPAIGQEEICMFFKRFIPITYKNINNI